MAIQPCARRMDQVIDCARASSDEACSACTIEGWSYTLFGQQGSWGQKGLESTHTRTKAAAQELRILGEILTENISTAIRIAI